MLPKINRLKSDNEFKNVFKKGRISENQFFRIKFLKNQKNYSRFGFIISTKVLKKATLRNIVKRRLRSSVRSFIKDIKPGFDIVIWPKGISISLKYKDFLNYIKELITKNDLISIY